MSAGSREVIELAVGDSRTVHVRARIPANPTGLRVTEGSKYEFLVPGDQTWIDFYIRTTADGYSRSPLGFVQELFRGLKPLPNSNWFVLGGAIDAPRNFPFLIGRNSGPVSMPANGELIFFANDAKGFYCNNRGSLSVQITRVA
jgi:hypothetical protein